jgi:hypothetical protein
MRLAGLLLLLAGWALVYSAVILLHSMGQRAGFVAAGLGVEIMGLVLVFRSHIRKRGAKK